MPFKAVPWPARAQTGDCQALLEPRFPGNAPGNSLSWTLQLDHTSLLTTVHTANTSGAISASRAVQNDTNATPTNELNAKPPRPSSSRQHTSVSSSKASVPSSSPGIPCVLIGDLFAPCNALGLFAHQPELDDLDFASPGATVRATPPLPKTFQEGVHNLHRSRHHQPGLPGASARHPAGDNTTKASQPAHDATGAPGQPQHERAEAASIAGGSALPMPGWGDAPVAYPLDPYVPSMPSMINTLKGQRVLFNSASLANSVRRQQVIASNAVQEEQRAAEAEVQRSMSGWMSQLSDWMHPHSNMKPDVHSAAPWPSSPSAMPGTLSDARSGGSLVSQLSPEDKAQFERIKRAVKDPDPGVVQVGTRGGAAQDDPRGSIVKGPFQVATLMKRLLWHIVRLAEARDGPDLAALDARNTAAEARHIKQGGKGMAPGVEVLTSFVGRVPLQFALELLTSAPSLFSYLAAPDDWQAARKLHGKAGAIKTQAPAEGIWMRKDASGAVKAVRTTGAAQSMDDLDLNQAPSIPVFQVPGITMSVKTAEGQLVYLTPTFLSLNQVQAVVEASKAMVKSTWLATRKAQREVSRKRLEMLALALSGLGGPHASSAAPRPSMPEEEEEDEDGMGELPESKALLAELGEGSKPPAGGPLSGAGAPPTGLASMISTMAVGAISLAGHGLAAVGDTLDILQTKSPWGWKSMGLPERLAVSAGFLDETLEQLETENQAHSKAWHAKRARKQLRKAAAAAGDASAASKQLSVPVDLSTVLEPQSSSAAAGPQTTGSTTEQKSEEVRDGNDDKQTAPVSKDSNSNPEDDSTDKQLHSSSSGASHDHASHDTLAASASQQIKQAASKQQGKVVIKQSVAAAERKQSASGGSEAGPKPGPGVVLESLPGVAIVLKAAWAVMSEAQRGGGEFSGLLINGLAGQVQISTNHDAELSVTMLVQMKADQSPHSGSFARMLSDAFGQPASKRGLSGMGAGQSLWAGRASSASHSNAQSQEPAADPEPIRFEIGLHVHKAKLTGEVPRDEPDQTTKEKTALRGLLLMADLGLAQDPDLGPVSFDGNLLGAPPVGFFDMTHLLTVHKLKEQQADGDATAQAAASSNQGSKRK